MKLFPNAKRTQQKLVSEFYGKKILDLGCGSSKIPGAIGIDRRIRKDVSLNKQRDIDSHGQ